MPAVRLLDEAQLRRLVPLDGAAVACIEAAFASLGGGGGGEVVMPPVLSMAIAEHNGEIDVKTAYVPGLPVFAVKMSPGFFDNPQKGLPSTSGLMVVFASETGLVRALLLDNGYLTDVRTAAAGAVAAKHLARKDASRVAVLGTGMQAELQVRAAMLVRPVEEVRVWGRSREKADTLVRRLSAAGVRASAAVGAVDAVAQADIVVTATPAAAPILRAEWLRPGQHVTAMGSDQHHKNELEPACLSRADRYVADRLSQTRDLGELRSAIASGDVARGATFDELGAICCGTAPGRRDAGEITIADLTGTGVQDTAIAALALERADGHNAGTTFVS